MYYHYKLHLRHQYIDTATRSVVWYTPRSPYSQTHEHEIVAKHLPHHPSEMDEYYIDTYVDSVEYLGQSYELTETSQRYSPQQPVLVSLHSTPSIRSPIIS